MRIHIHGLKEIENELMLANEKLLAADTNSALTSLNKAINDLKDLRKFLEEDEDNVL